jgi:hypothetical protein
MHHERWDEKKIIETLQTLHSQGFSIAPSSLHKTHHGLLAAGKRIFGDSKSMYIAANIDPDSIIKSQKWTDEDIIKTILQYYETNSNLSRPAMRHLDNKLVLAASRRFGSWYKALEKAGIDSTKYKKSREPWTKQEIIVTLIKIKNEGGDVRPSALSKSYSGLLDAAYRLFDSLESMYGEASINPKEIGMLRKWTNEAIISELRELYSKGEDIRPISLHHNYSGLYKAGQKCFGNTRKMYLAAGFDPASIGFKEHNCRIYTKENIIYFLKKLESVGENLSADNLDRKHHGLYNAGLKFFSSMWNFYQAAGIEPNKYLSKKHGYWNRERLLTEIRELKRNGIDLHSKEFQQTHSDLYSAARRYFGDWDEACNLAEFTPNESKQSEEQVIAGLQDIMKKGENLDPKSLNKNHHELYWLAIARFGSPVKMYEAIGVDPRIFKRKNKVSWDQVKVIEQIRFLETKEEDLRATKVAMWHSDLYLAALKYFGNWHQACLEAGVPKERYFVISKRKLYSDEQIINEIQTLYQRGAPLDSYSAKVSNPLLHRHAAKRFNGWYNAIEAAGIPSKQFRVVAHKSYWTKEIILNEIRTHESAFHDLSYSGVARLRGDLVTAAAVKFGSWRAAVKEAGFDYSKVVKQHDKYSDEELLDFLMVLYEQGIPLDTQSLKRISQSKLNIIWQRFGSLENAIKAIGLDYEKIRKDWLSECYKGKVFERYVLQALNVLSWDVEYQKRFNDELEAELTTYIPDFYEQETGLWIDAKLSAWGFGVDISIKKYLAKSKGMMIIYLNGKPRDWPNDSVQFVPIDSFYNDLIKCDAYNLVKDFEKLKMGIIRPSLQSELDKFVEA